jgi:hypothetical protein
MHSKNSLKRKNKNNELGNCVLHAGITADMFPLSDSNLYNKGEIVSYSILISVTEHP